MNILVILHESEKKKEGVKNYSSVCVMRNFPPGQPIRSMRQC